MTWKTSGSLTLFFMAASAWSWSVAESTKLDNQTVSSLAVIATIVCMLTAALWFAHFLLDLFER